MDFRGRAAVMMLAALSLPSQAAAQPLAASEPMLAVLDFTVTRNGSLVLPKGVGAAAADLLVDHLAASGRYRVLDRGWLPEVVGTEPGEDRPMAAVRAGAIEAGVDYLVVGSITRYSNERRRRAYGGALLRKAMFGGLGRSRTNAVIGLSVRIVDARTGEVVATATPLGDASRKKLIGGALGAVGAGGVSTSIVGERNALVSEALEEAVAAASQALVNAASRLEREPARSAALQRD